MYYIYVLLCRNYHSKQIEFYIGFTKDIKKRPKRHLASCVKTTKTFDYIELVYLEGCLSKKDAIIREKQLKTGFGRGYLKRRIKNYLSDKRD